MSSNSFFVSSSLVNACLSMLLLIAKIDSMSDSNVDFFMQQRYVNNFIISKPLVCNHNKLIYNECNKNVLHFQNHFISLP